MLTGPQAPKPEPYWRLEYAPEPMTLERAVEEARERIFRAVELRLRADVPIACCLSGGIDSTALASIAVKQFGATLTAFSIIDSDERYDESENINIVLDDLGCESHQIATTTEGFLERMTDLVSYHDAPIATISYYVHASLSQEIRKQGFKVSLSGTAADELFTGYYDHYAFWLAEMHERPDFAQLVDDWRGSYGAVVRNPQLQDPLAFVKNPMSRDHLTLEADLFSSFLVEPFYEKFAEATYSSSPLRNRMLNEIRHETVPVILREDDLNSMRYSVENRSPYLDRELAKFLFSVPSEHLIHEGRPKWLLRAAAEGFVPDSVRLDRRKKGFNASILSLLNRDDPATAERLLAPGPIFDYVKREAIESFLSRDMTANSLSKFMFSFVSTKLFLESDIVTGGTDSTPAAGHLGASH